MKTLQKINQKKVDEIVEKVNNSEYEVSWEEGNPKFKSKTNIKRGKSAKNQGLLFEKRVREDLEEKGWIVTKWSNTVDFEKDKVVPSKRKYNPFTKALTIGTGFPDLLCFKKAEENYEVIGVEVKTTGLLDKFEKGQSIWYLEKKIIPRILIAKKIKVKNRIEIEYIDFKEKYLDKNK